MHGFEAILIVMAAAVAMSLLAQKLNAPFPPFVALAGAGAAALTSVTSAILITNVETLDQIRFWQVGALTGRTTDILLQ
ncbi:MAG TPA: hypothetical protein VN018_04650, partial [Brevundimonas sp.]|nr:hypothetical protein [Brevundimonas sp.]